MNVFISCSGQKSRMIAEVLRKYLPCFIHDLKPFMSKHDIESGVRWIQQITDQLCTTNFGVLCLTSDNLNSPWLLFESGALTKLTNSRACGVLFGEVTATDISGPLAQFQHRLFKKDEIYTLLNDLNDLCANRLEVWQLNLGFEKFWPDLERDVANVLATQDDDKPIEPARSISDVLNDLVLAVRDLKRLVEAQSPERSLQLIEGILYQTLSKLDNAHLEPLISLVSSGGYRIIGDYTELAKEYSSEILDELIFLGLLRKSVRSEKQVVELAHDALCAPVLSYLPRLERRNNQMDENI